MRILITGGAGYIGSILVPMALSRGHEVTVLDNFMYGQSSLLDVVHDKKLRLVRGDVRDERVVKDLASKADAVFPLACLVGAPLCAREPLAATTINRDAIRMLADSMSPNQLLVFPSTNSGYGIGANDVFCDEDTPLNPISLYGRLKVDIESHLLERGNAVTFRLATVFGISPRMRLDLLVNDFVYRAVNDRFIVLFEPHFKRNYLHVRDAARAFLHAIDNFDAMKGRPYNVGLSDANLSKMELCDRIRQHIPELSTPVAEVGEDPDKRNYVISNERIERTGFKTQTCLDDGIAELIKGYQIVRRNQFSNI